MSRHAGTQSQTLPTHTVEDYLMSMYVMERDHGEIIAARLAEVLAVAPATVAMTLKRMKRDTWITGTGRKTIHLTETGRAAAFSVTRRHMLTEWLLVKILKVPISQTHTEAHGIEHTISPQLEERMRNVLGDPQVCPHGNPFPGCEAAVANWVALTDLPGGETVIIRRIHESVEDNLELLNFLVENGVMPGVQAQIVENLPFNQTLTIAIGSKPITLGFPVAHYIFAEQTKNR